MTSARLLALPLAAVLGCAPSPPSGSRGSADPPHAFVVPPAPVDPGTPAPTPPAENAGPVVAAFLQSVGEGTVDLGQVTPAFLAVVAPPRFAEPGAPAGYDAHDAKAWFAKSAGAVKGAPPPDAAAAAGDAVVASGPTAGGRYAVRLVRTPGGWKVDWFQTLLDKAPTPAAPGADGPFTAFAAACAADALHRATDDAAVAVAAALLSPELRRELGKPFPTDEARGYNVAALKLELASRAGGASAWSAAPTADPAAYRVSRTPAKPLSLKLVRGPAPGQWLVGEIKAE